MEPATDFTLGALENLEPSIATVRQYRNRSKKKQQSAGGACDKPQQQCHGGSGGDEKLSEVLAKIASLRKTSDESIDRTKLVRTYNVTLRLKKTSLYKCFDCDSCFTNPDFLELHEKTHATLPPNDASGGGRQDIDLKQQSFDESEMNLKQNAWFAGDFSDTEEDDEAIIQLDCTVEEREDNYDITFDRNKCEKTYTVKYKVKKEPVGKCERCDKVFYAANALELHKMEHERFIDFDAIEPMINMEAPKLEESTLVLDESFYQVLSGIDATEILELSEGAVDTKRSPSRAEITVEYKLVPRRASKESVGSPPQPERQTPPPDGNGEKITGKFQCKICAKRFRFRPALGVHERTHDNNRPFRCAECGRQFISKSKLFLHSYGHTRERRAEIRCDVCGEGFRRPKQLLEHKLSGHAK